MEDNQMKIKHLILIILSLILVVPVVYADDYQDGVDAFDKKDFKAALKKLKPLAEKGHAKAQNKLGVMYVNGLEVTQDYKEAVKWYHLAAEQGFVFAQFNLGAMYAEGNGVIQDNVYAHMWWNIAASSGKSKNASKNRDIVAKKMTTSQREKAQDLARECVKKNYKGC